MHSHYFAGAALLLTWPARTQLQRTTTAAPVCASSAAVGAWPPILRCEMLRAQIPTQSVLHACAQPRLPERKNKNEKQTLPYSGPYVFGCPKLISPPRRHP